MNTSAEAWGDEAEIDLRVLLTQLWRRRWWIVASTFLGTAMFVAAAFLMTPKYRAAAVALPAASDRSGMATLGSMLGQFGGLAALAGINVDSADSRTAEIMAVLRSRAFTERFISERELMPELFRGKWDAQGGKWKGDRQDWPTLAQAYKYFDKSVRTISQDKKTGLITVAIEWPDPTKAADLANDLVGRLNAEMRARAARDTNASINYLQKELTATSTVETREAISRLMEAQINQRMLANVTAEYSLRVVDRAMPPDRKDVARPRKRMMAAIGMALGAAFGILAVLVANVVAPARKAGA
jgi:uncharacterized protein involved in exopolysaccharide biosynthesis